MFFYISIYKNLFIADMIQSGVGFCKFNNIYIADTGNSKIVKYTSNQSNGITIAGGNGYGIQSNQFKEPYSLALDKQGNLFVSERLNHRIQVFQIDHNTLTC